MTDDEKRVRIAEACGWNIVCRTAMAAYAPRHIWDARLKAAGLENVSCVGYEEIPDYLHSLDAMAEAEKAVLGTDDKIGRFVANLMEELGFLDEVYTFEKINPDHVWKCLSATATQRADALLAVLDSTPSDLEK
jgi:hypothetical protein